MRRLEPSVGLDMLKAYYDVCMDEYVFRLDGGEVSWKRTELPFALRDGCGDRWLVEKFAIEKGLPHG